MSQILPRIGARPGILAIAFFYGLILQALITLTPLYLDSLGIGPAMLGLLVSFPAWMVFVARVPSGIVADRWGERVVLTLTSLLMFFSVPLFIYGGLFAIVIAQVLSGLSRSAYHPTAELYVTKTSKIGLGSSIGLYQTTMSAGMITGPLLIGYTLSHGYRWPFILIGVGSLICALVTCLIPEADTVRGSKSGRRKPGAMCVVLGMRPVVLAGICRYAAAVPMALFSSLLPVYFRQLGMSSGTIGLMASLRSVLLMVTSLLYACTFERMPKHVPWIFGMALSGLSIVLLPLSESLWALALCVAMMGIGSAPLQILPLMLISAFVDESQRGVAIAFSGTLWGLALVVNPLVLGVVAEMHSLTRGLYTASVPLIALALMTGPVFRWALALPQNKGEGLSSPS